MPICLCDIPLVILLTDTDAHALFSFKSLISRAVDTLSCWCYLAFKTDAHALFSFKSLISRAVDTLSCWCYLAFKTHSSPSSLWSLGQSTHFPVGVSSPSRQTHFSFSSSLRSSSHEQQKGKRYPGLHLLHEIPFSLVRSHSDLQNSEIKVNKIKILILGHGPNLSSPQKNNSHNDNK